MRRVQTGPWSIIDIPRVKIPYCSVVLGFVVQFGDSLGCILPPGPSISIAGEDILHFGISGHASSRPPEGSLIYPWFVSLTRVKKKKSPLRIKEFPRF